MYDHDLHDAMTQRTKKQYENAGNFNKRVELVSRFSTNPVGFTHWVFDHIAFPPKARILELGCGPGYLWYGNLDKMPKGATAVLTDFSEGMVETARNGLGGLSGALEFTVADAQQIPYEDASFDIVIANHMLYHVPDRPKALAEIRRVLKPGGTLYATTIGKDNLRELRLLFKSYFRLPDYPTVTAADAFGLENGAAQLGVFFDGVTLDPYEDHLEVTEAEPLIGYIMSSQSSRMLAFMTPERIRGFTEFLNGEIAANGFIYMTKASGLFIAKQHVRN